MREGESATTCLDLQGETEETLPSHHSPLHTTHPYVPSLSPSTPLSPTLSPLSPPTPLTPGFSLSNSAWKCVCDPVIRKSGIQCYINNPANTWIGFYNDPHYKTGVMFHDHCPYGYCSSQSVNVTISDPDIQCENNRTAGSAEKTTVSLWTVRNAPSVPTYTCSSFFHWQPQVLSWWPCYFSSI